MTILDASHADGIFDAGYVAFGHVVVESSRAFAWDTPDGHRVYATGSGFTYGPDLKPTGGTATLVQVDLGADRDVDITFSGMSVPLAPLIKTTTAFWATLLGGDDSVHAPDA